MSDDDDIGQLFERVKKYFDGRGEESLGMFRMLVDVTLKFRGELNERGGGPLTVEETRAALTHFMEVIKTKSIPEGLEGRQRELVIRWLEELKMMRTH